MKRTFVLILLLQTALLAGCWDSEKKDQKKDSQFYEGLGEREKVAPPPITYFDEETKKN